MQVTESCGRRAGRTVTRQVPHLTYSTGLDTVQTKRGLDMTAPCADCQRDRRRPSLWHLFHGVLRETSGNRVLVSLQVGQELGRKLRILTLTSYLEGQRA